MPSDIQRCGSSELERCERLTFVIYILQFAALFVGLTSFIAVIINYIKRRDVEGTYLETHFRWQIRTFWFVLLWSIVSGLTAIIGVGYLLGLITWVWFIYRVVKGSLRLHDKLRMYV